MEKIVNPLSASSMNYLQPTGIVERSDEAIRKKEGLKQRKEVVKGDLPEDGVTILENGMKILVDLWNGHKTGFYLDQRDNRAMIRQYAKGKRVLNCFSYTGGFSISAAFGGAKEIINVDESLPALEIGEKNFL